MRESIKNSIMDTMADLQKIGLVDEITMRNIAALCLPDVKEYSPAEVVGLRKKNKLSQSALAVAMNVSTSTDSKGNEAPRNLPAPRKGCLSI